MWIALPIHDASIRQSIRATQQEGPEAIARLAALCLWYRGRRAPQSQHYDGPEGLPPLGYLANALELERAAEPGHPHWLQTWNVRPDRVDEAAYIECKALGKNDRQAARHLLRWTRWSYPDKGRAVDQTDALAFFAHRRSLAGCEVCVSHLLETFSHMDAWEKKQHRSNDVIAVLWPMREEWRPLIFEFASKLVIGTALDGAWGRVFRPLRMFPILTVTTPTIWGQIHATCGVLGAIVHMAGPLEAARFERQVRAWNRNGWSPTPSNALSG